ncbi:FadR/GntR family transcriptional regulator [Sphaerochaeta sp. S2]|uniref:FadR/GntR family transcriptional regulator n=1 Tax=Sphaerochaeta sp. S2 TaxID=2798868 RepID=UPI0018E922AF|nr:FadR/GntR family transcriptional regulator [Sphaerochaeta sp. S2]MBJ2357310.1 FadR family transcriptional regulator [Sphaerochaeta sp. S2]
MLEPIKTKKIYTLIMQQIQDLIDEKQLKPGDRLPSERDLATALSVSRASVRQAITALATKGLLTVQQGDGTYVTTPSMKADALEALSEQLVDQQISPNEIVETRLLIECECARLCAMRATPEICDQLESLLEHNREARGERASLETMNRDLHDMIALGAQNKALQRIMSDIWTLMNENMWYFLKQKSNDRNMVVEKHLRQHREIVDAIKAHDPQLAKKKMREHLSDIDSSLNTLIS